MQRVVAWMLAGLMLAAAIWVMRSTQDPGREEPAVVASRGPAVAAGAAAPQAGEAVAPSRAGGPDAIAAGTRSPLDAAARRAARAPGSDAGVRDVRSIGSPTRVALQGSSAVAAPGTRSDAAPPPIPQEDPPTPDAAPDLAGAEGPAADCAQQLGVWTELEIQGRINQEMRRSNVDYETARRTVLARLAVGYRMAEQQLGADAPVAALKSRAEQIGFLGASIPPDSFIQDLVDAGDC